MDTPIISFPCTECNKSFSKKVNLLRHFDRIHTCSDNKNVTPSVKPRSVKRPRSFKCPLCESKFPSSKDFSEHTLEAHQINIKEHYYKFDSKEKFLLWKRAIQAKDSSYFVQKSGLRKLPCHKDSSLLEYVCHRSGFYNKKVNKEVGDEKRQRRIKAQGSVKINAYCPAKVRAIFESNGTVKVTYVSTHLGHSSDIAHIKIAYEERRAIAKKIAAGVPFDVILDELRATSGQGLRKIHLLNRYDLRNIQRRFKVNDEDTYHQNEIDIDVNLILEDVEECDSFTEYKPECTFVYDFKDKNSDKVPSRKRKKSVIYPRSKVCKFIKHSIHGSTNAIRICGTETKTLGQEFQSQNRETLKKSQVGPSLPVMKSEILNKFFTLLNGITTVKEAKWVTNHVHSMAELLKTATTDSEVPLQHPNVNQAKLNHTTTTSPTVLIQQKQVIHGNLTSNVAPHKDKLQISQVNVSSSNAVKLVLLPVSSLQQLSKKQQELSNNNLKTSEKVEQNTPSPNDSIKFRVLTSQVGVPVQVASESPVKLPVVHKISSLQQSPLVKTIENNTIQSLSIKPSETVQQQEVISSNPTRNLASPKERLLTPSTSPVKIPVCGAVFSLQKLPIDQQPLVNNSKEIPYVKLSKCTQQDEVNVLSGSKNPTFLPMANIQNKMLVPIQTSEDKNQTDSKLQMNSKTKYVILTKSIDGSKTNTKLSVSKMVVPVSKINVPPLVKFVSK